MDIDKEDSVIFNTHAYVKKLIASGMPEAQAEAQMEIFIQFIDNKLATKLSLINAKNELELKIKELENNLSSKIKILEKDIVIKLGSMIVITITILGTMIKIF